MLIKFVCVFFNALILPQLPRFHQNPFMYREILGLVLSVTYCVCEFQGSAYLISKDNMEKHWAVLIALKYYPAVL